MLEIPTLNQLVAAAKDDVETEINGSLGARLRASIAYALAFIGYMYLKTLQFLARQLFIDLAEPNFALLWASIYGVEPNEATASQGPVLVKGTTGSVLTGTEILQRDDGFEFQLSEAVVMPAVGEVQLGVIATEAGSIGNTDPGATLTFTSPPAGITPTATVVGAGLIDGFDVETSEQVKARALAQIRSPKRGGSEEEYEVWAREVTGVQSAYARGSAFGIGSVLLIITQEWDPTDPNTSPIPSEGLIGQVEAHIETKKPAGLNLVAVQPPTLQELDPYIVLEPDTPAIRDAVTKSLALALAEVEPGQTSYYDDMVAACDRAAGEEHHRLFVSDGLGGYGPYDVRVGDNHLLVVGTINWEEP